MRTGMPRSGVVLFAITVILVSTAAAAPGAAPPRPSRRLPASELRQAIAMRLRGGPPGGVSQARWRCVLALYDGSTRLPVWFDSAGGMGRVPELVRALAAAPGHALAVDAVRLDSIAAAIGRARSGASAPAAGVAEADVLLSIAFAGLAEELLMGQLDPRAVTRSWHIARSRADVDGLISRRVTLPPLDTSLSAFAPDDPVYAALRKGLADYRAIVSRGGWGAVPAGPTLRPGAAGEPARLGALARRLWREGYLADSAAPGGGAVYDASLAAAVARFQARHSIRVDSALSPETVKALNVSAEYRVSQIAANLERIRWLPHALPDRHLIVNVPSFRLLLREGGRTVSSMKVVVGAEYRDRRTPVFADSMSYVVFQPYWNVTPNITLREVIPRAARDPSYLARNDYEVVRGGGDDAPVVGAALLTPDAVRAGRVRVRQRPGERNALGRAKFIFPNSYNVYLHDTPQRTLFARDVRAFSHGCIRVEKPAELASWVLGWDAARVAAAAEGPRANQYASLPRKLPVFLIYLTAFTRDGELFFGNDLYGEDAALVRRVTAGALPDARVAQALERLRRSAAA